MAISVGDAVLKLGVDSSGLNKGMQDAQSKVNQSLDKMQAKLRGAGVAFTAVGVAGLKMVDSARKINAELGVTAITFGTTTKAMRDMVLETANVTFSIDEVTKTFDMLARAGVKDEEVLKSVATAFDTLGDAIGISASQATDIMVPAMKTFRLSAEEAADKIDMMTYMVRNSTIDLEDFNTMVGYTSQDMVDAGLTIEDLAAAMMYMSDSGVEPGKVMLREWNKAVTQSQKEGIALTEALGMTTEELERYKTGLTGAIGLTQQYADEANKQYGIMDKLKFLWSKLTLTFGSVLAPLEPLFAMMTAMGPVMIFLSTSMGRSTLAFMANAAATMKSHVATALHVGSSATLAGAQNAVAGATGKATVAQVGLNRAMMANPIIAIIAGITALVFAIKHLYENWTHYSIKFESAWASFKKTALNAFDTVLGVAENMTRNILPNLSAQIGEVRTGISTMIDAEKVRLDALAVERAWYELTKKVKDNTDEMMSDVEMATSQAISNAQLVADSERQILEQRAQYYRDMTYERLDLIDKQMMAELQAMDPALAAQVERYNKQIGALGEADEDRNRQIEEDRVKELYNELRTGEDITAARRREIEDQIADTEGRWEKEHILEERNLLISQSNYEAYFEGQKTLIDKELEVKIAGYNADLGAYQELLDEKYKMTYEHVRKIAELYGQVTGGEGYAVPEGAIPEARVRPTNPIEFFKWLQKVATRVPGYQHGGPITEPTLLYGLRSQRPYAMAHEGERVTPGATTTNTFNISQMVVREEADINRIARELYRMQQTRGRQLGVA